MKGSLACFCAALLLFLRVSQVACQGRPTGCQGGAHCKRLPRSETGRQQAKSLSPQPARGRRTRIRPSVAGTRSLHQLGPAVRHIQHGWGEGCSKPAGGGMLGAGIDRFALRSTPIAPQFHVVLSPASLPSANQAAGSRHRHSMQKGRSAALDAPASARPSPRRRTAAVTGDGGRLVQCDGQGACRWSRVSAPHTHGMASSPGQTRAKWAGCDSLRFHVEIRPSRQAVRRDRLWRNEVEQGPNTQLIAPCRIRRTRAAGNIR